LVLYIFEKICREVSFIGVIDGLGCLDSVANEELVANCAQDVLVVAEYGEVYVRVSHRTFDQGCFGILFN
jgi:hypothetical protein